MTAELDKERFVICYPNPGVTQGADYFLAAYTKECGSQRVRSDLERLWQFDTVGEANSQLLVYPTWSVGNSSHPVAGKVMRLVFERKAKVLPL